MFYERTKHIKIDCHIVREKVSHRANKLLSVPSSGQIADGFTKALPISSFQTFLSKMGAQDIHALAYGVLESSMLKTHGEDEAKAA